MELSPAIEAKRILIENALHRIDFKSEPDGLYEPCRYLLALGGKRVRPIFTLIASEMYERSTHESIPLALAVEVFHNFTLMHDDILDQASIRRGKATVHEKWGLNTGILSGDALLIRAYELLQEGTPVHKLSPVLAMFNRTTREVCEGQQMDMNFENLEIINMDDYIEMIRLKTAVLLGASLYLGACAAGAEEKESLALYRFGESVGIAFQVMDDYLDTYGTSELTGKRKGGDIIAGKKTFLVISAYEQASVDDKKRLLQLLNNRQIDEETKIREVTAIFDQYGVKEAVQSKFGYYANLAEEALRDAQKDPGVAGIQELNDIAAALLRRTN